MSPVRLLDQLPSPEHVVARLGLIADTHMPDRLAALPDALAVAFANVDLILHAGDVGELPVLDALSAIAPVIAVHGNDETAQAQRELPYQQLLSVGGVRLLLTHAHHPDHADELASRRDDRWAPKLERRAAMGRRAGAAIVVFGHTHVPMLVPWGEVLLVNPGAIAPGSFFVRQTLRSVARLLITIDGAVAVEHLDLDAGGRPFAPAVDLEAGFVTAMAGLSATIAVDDLQRRLPGLWRLFVPGMLTAGEVEALRGVLRHVASQRWERPDTPPVTADELTAALWAALDRPLAARVVSALAE